MKQVNIKFQGGGEGGSHIKVMGLMVRNFEKNTLRMVPTNKERNIFVLFITMRGKEILARANKIQQKLGVTAHILIEIH